MGSEFTSLPYFRPELAHIASKEPLVAASAFGDIDSWFVQYVGRLRRAKQQFETNVRMAGDKLPGNILAAAESE